MMAFLELCASLIVSLVMILVSLVLAIAATEDSPEIQQARKEGRDPLALRPFRAVAGYTRRGIVRLMGDPRPKEEEKEAEKA